MALLLKFLGFSIYWLVAPLLNQIFSFLLYCFFQVSLSSCVGYACLPVLPVLLCSGGAHAPYSIAIKLCWLRLSSNSSVQRWRPCSLQCRYQAALATPVFQFFCAVVVPMLPTVSLSRCVGYACLPVLLRSGGAHVPSSITIKLCWLCVSPNAQLHHCVRPPGGFADKHSLALFFWFVLSFHSCADLCVFIHSTALSKRFTKEALSSKWVG